MKNQNKTQTQNQRGAGYSVGVGTNIGNQPSYDAYSDCQPPVIVNHKLNMTKCNMVGGKSKKKSRKSTKSRKSKKSTHKSSKKLMCPKACCGAPVDKCVCSPNCPHCNCHEILRLRKMLKKSSKSKRSTHKQKGGSPASFPFDGKAANYSADMNTRKFDGKQPSWSPDDI
jgi:hypothetical protein